MAAAGNSSRFAVTCGLLRQYMREQQLGGAGAAFRQPPPPPMETTTEEEAAEETDARTMQLFPTRAGAGTGTSSQPSRQERLEAPAKGPLTIFYNGRVLVLKDFPADKAMEIMQLAASTGSCSPEPKNGAPAVAEKKPPPPPAARPSADLPIARKVSLQRFLQKRKERIGAIEPYPKLTATSISPAAEEKDVATPAAAAGKLVTTVKDQPAASWLRL